MNAIIRTSAIIAGDEVPNDRGNRSEDGDTQRPKVDVGLSPFKWPSTFSAPPAVSYAQEGVNFYLRLGAIGK